MTGETLRKITEEALYTTRLHQVRLTTVKRKDRMNNPVPINLLLVALSRVGVREEENIMRVCRSCLRKNVLEVLSIISQIDLGAAWHHASEVKKPSGARLRS